MRCAPPHSASRCAWSGVTRNSDIIIIRPHAGLTPDETRDLRARALRYALDCYERHKAAGTEDGGDATKEVADDVEAVRISFGPIARRLMNE